MVYSQSTRSHVSRIVGTVLALSIAGFASSQSLRSESGMPPEPPPPGLGPNNSSATTQSPAVTVIAPPRPTADQLAGDSLFQFIVHHGSTHYSVAAGIITGGLLRWRGGRAETICPATAGLEQGYNEFVTARVRAVATFVGAPVQAQLPCEPNVQILFTSEPGAAMKAVLKWAARSLGVGFPHQEQRELQISADHAIQGWYVTAGGGYTVLNRDPSLIGGIQIQSLWPRVVPVSAKANGGNRSILSVVLLVDTTKMADFPIEPLADYLALAALTVIETPDHCDALPSILELTSSSSCNREKPAELTAGDLAFLKWLYYQNTGLGKTLSRGAIQYNMMREFQGG